MSKFEKAMDEYFDHFGVCYPYTIGKGFPAKTDKENIALIRQCIRDNKPVVCEPKYRDGCDY